MPETTNPTGGTTTLTVLRDSTTPRKRIRSMDKPNPGSQEAKDQGCICAVLDNNHGRFPPYPPDGWWITSTCPVHDRRKVDG